MLIDIVYTWVDGFEPKFIQKKNKYLNSSNITTINDNPDIRFESLNEIYFSIKSVLKYVPWINKIYIVTDNQIPELDNEIYSTGKIEIIDHTDIIPSEYLPTFYSDVIESYLHNIPGLSEIFLYNNDDLFFLDYVEPSDIVVFENGKDNLIVRNIFNIDVLKSKKSEYSKRIVKTFDILRTLTDKQLVNNHHTKILRKSTLKYIEHEFPTLLAEMRENKFRNSDSIQYLFFAINIDNIFFDNIIVNKPSDVIEYHFGNDLCERVYYKFDITKKYKFACFNSMNFTYKDIFYNYIEHFV
jgi:hypothetical protein